MINKEVELIIDKICRCCMCENENMHNVFEDRKDTQDSSVLLSEMLIACASVEVVFGDGLPYNVCDTCQNKLSTAYEFRQQCQKSDSALRELTSTETKGNIPKEEDIIIQPDVHDDVFDEEDNLPLVQRTVKRKRGRPKAKQDDNFPCTFCNKILHTKKGLRVHLRSHTAVADVYKHSKEREEDSGKGIKEELEEIKPEENTNAENITTASQNQVQEIDDNDVFNNDFPFSDDEPDAGDSDDFLKALENKTNKTKETEKDKSLYKCKECNKVMTTHIGLKIHMRRHTGADLSFCKLCNKSFTKISHLNRHMRTHGIIEKEKMKEFKLTTDAKGKRIMECDFCDRKFKYRKSFVHHMQVEHGMSDVESDMLNAHEEINNLNAAQKDTTDGVVQEGPSEQNREHKEEVMSDDGQDNLLPGNNMDGILSMESFLVKKESRKTRVCHVCGQSFNRANHLTRHMTLHRAVLVHQCDKCEKAFCTEEHLKKHVEDDHINKPYVCTVCNKPFSRGEHLIRHLKVHQSSTDSEKILKCSICDTTFTRSDHLARHTKIHLLQDKRHVCVECGKAFNRLDNLKTHQRIHTGIKDTSKLHLCIYCGKEFNNSSNMIVHMRRHTGERPYKCNECGKGFPRSHDLKCHERTHSGEKPYLCTLCGKSFNKSNKLLRHSRVHTGERPYVCNICGRAFTQSNDLSLHMRRHTGARPYACGVCPARFIQSGQLKTHRRTTGHWMETQPDLKGGHRVEPVIPAHEPVPIRFKSHGMKKEKEMIETQVTESQSIHSGITVHPIEEVMVPSEASDIQSQPQRILMGIMGNIKIQNEIQPLLIDSTKLVELHNAGLVNLPSVIQTANGEEIKLKSEVPTFNMSHCEENIVKQDGNASGTFQDSSVVYSSAGHTSTTFTTSENFTFQNYH